MLVRYNDDDHVPLREAEIDETFGKQDLARVFVKRGEIPEDEIERGQTEIAIVDDESASLSEAEFGGVLRDIDREGSLTEFLVESKERFARDALPTAGGERWENVDDIEIVFDAIDSVDQLEPGTVEEVKTPITMVFSHTSQAKKIREIQSATGAEVKYQPNGEVDYVERRGEDRTDTTLSPANQNITGDFNAEKKGGSEDITHLRLIGAGEGRHQVTVNLVPEDDPLNYEEEDEFDNVERYTADHWEEGDRREWEVKSNKDHTEVNSLTRLGETIMEDVQTSHVEAFAEIEGIDVELGDSFSVVYPEEEIDEEMRVVELTTVIDASGFTYLVDLSTRRESLEDPENEERKDTDRYNLAFEGTSVTTTTSGGRQPVSIGYNYDMSFYFPDEVKMIERANLHIKARRYRAYTGITEPSRIDFSAEEEVDLSGEYEPGEKKIGELELSQELNDWPLISRLEIADPGFFGTLDSGLDWSYSIRTGALDDRFFNDIDQLAVEETSSHVDVANLSGLSSLAHLPVMETAKGPGDSIISRVELQNQTDEEQDVNARIQVISPTHQHDPQAGIFEFFGGDEVDPGSGEEFFPEECITKVNDEFVLEEEETPPETVYDNPNVSWESVIYEEDDHDEVDQDGIIDTIEFTDDSQTLTITSSNVLQNIQAVETDVNRLVFSWRTQEEIDFSDHSYLAIDLDVFYDGLYYPYGVAGNELGPEKLDIWFGEDHRPENIVDSFRLEWQDWPPTRTTLFINVEDLDSSEIFQIGFRLTQSQGYNRTDPMFPTLDDFRTPDNRQLDVYDMQLINPQVADGTGDFEAELEIEDYLISGEVNNIQITSQTLGNIQAHVDIDAYRQILGDG